MDLSHKVVCFDLDGTLAEPTWPSPTIGEPIPEGVALLAEYVEKDCAILVYTSRPASHRGAIWKWLQGNGIEVYDVITDKPLAGLYVDDRALRFERETPVVKLDEVSAEGYSRADDGTTWEMMG